MGSIVGDAAMVGDMARQLLFVTELKVERSQLEGQRLHSREPVSDGATVEERGIHGEATARECLAIVSGKILDARCEDSLER
jgi:hypothetical protein